ncbi:LCP family protein [Mycobacterium sp. NPDC048908]|uniref:LCP family protein n=1 Tax=Mycobacterium sp. NPDC048908 TaxID=3364292 RepID=UPI003722B4F8
MTAPDYAGGAGRANPGARRPRHRRPRQRAEHGIPRGAKVLGAIVSALTLVVSGIGWVELHRVAKVITTSEALAEEPSSPGADQNILIMGLDTRRDQRGGLLPYDLYDALHAGDEHSGENDADVLIVLHIPAGAGSVTAISIPRDDYVDLVGCPVPGCRGKVKHAYSLAYQQVIGRGDAAHGQAAENAADASDVAAAEQRAREAGRKAEIRTIRRLLQIPIDHFIEVSLAAFVQIARVVEPITVCLQHDTSDPYYSGANFREGIQQISAAQAMAFVRQRRDVNDAMFTDLDRTRRQQAFIASLLAGLRDSGALSDPRALQHLVDVAKDNVAVDAGFDLLGFVRYAATLSERPLSLYTLPITEFSRTSDGEDVNIIDVPTIRSIVHSVLSTPASSGSVIATGQVPSTTRVTPPGVVLNVVNGAGREGLASSLEKYFAKGQFTEGLASTADRVVEASSIGYGLGAQAAATALSDQLDLTATASDAVAPNTVQLTVGTDFDAEDYLNRDGSTPERSTGPTTTVSTVAAGATGTEAPAPTNLTRMSGQDVPCVR